MSEVAQRGRRARLAWLGLLAGCALVAGPAAAWPPEDQPLLTEPLRLDDSPTLPLLEPFRHAAGRPASHLLRYLEGPFGQWHRRAWRTIRWDESSHMDRRHAQRWLADHYGNEQTCDPYHLRLEGCQPLSAPPALSLSPRRDTVAIPLIGEPGRHQHAWLARLLPQQQARWPYVTAEQHWFQPLAYEQSQTDLLGGRTLTISPEILPPWLARLDAGLTGSLLANAGCGRGGACSTQVAFPADAFEKLWFALAPQHAPIPAWKCRTDRRITIMRYGGERDAFPRLVHCDSSVDLETIERISVLARPPGVPRPQLALPDEPDRRAAPGEWVPAIKLVHPRLLWLLQRIADEFPWRWIYIYSGYRAAEDKLRRGTHKSLHWEARALDITVQGIANEELLELCRKLPDIGCGYYPHHKFLHIDVRPRGYGQAFWIDAARPGEPVRYVDSWPGVVENGAMVWSKLKLQPSAEDLSD